MVIAEKRLYDTERHNSILSEVAKFYYDKTIRFGEGISKIIRNASDLY
jgi:hypothetical protein